MKPDHNLCLRAKQYAANTFLWEKWREMRDWRSRLRDMVVDVMICAYAESVVQLCHILKGGWVFFGWNTLNHANGIFVNIKATFRMLCTTF